MSQVVVGILQDDTNLVELNERRVAHYVGEANNRVKPSSNPLIFLGIILEK